MRIYEIEQSDEDEYSDFEIKNFFEKVSKDCQYYLQKANGKNLYRKIRNKIDILINCPIKRYTVTSDSKFTEIFDNKLKENGFHALRSNSIFTAPTTNQIPWFFGTPYVVFPINEFDLTYYDGSAIQSNDLGGNNWIQFIFPHSFYDDATNMHYSYEDYGKPYVEKKYTTQELMDKFWEKYGQYFHHGDNVQEAVGFGSEIMFVSNGYHAISTKLFEKYKHYLKF